MSFNLIDAVKALISNELINKAGSFLGESESGIQKAISGIIPTILGGLADKSASQEGAEMIASLALEQDKAGVADRPAEFFGNDISSLLTKGAGFLNGIFGDKAEGLTNQVAGFAGIKSTSASSLMAMVSSLLLGFLGKQASVNHLDSGDIASLLRSQVDNVQRAIPAGLNLGSIFGSSATAKTFAPPVSHHNKEIAENQGSAISYLLPLILFVLLAAAAWYFFGGGCQKPVHEVTHIIGDSIALGEKEVTPSPEKGMVDSSGNYMYEMGKMVDIDLPNGAGMLHVGEFSTENKLVQFLLNSKAVIDTVKGNWFEFTNVRFATGGTMVDSASMVQLKNIVAISKGFPAASFKVGGYTDNVGDSLANVALSQRRADAVVATLKKLGASAISISGAKGYGPQHPIGDNATAEGRAMNRRVALNVKSK